MGSGRSQAPTGEFQCGGSRSLRTISPAKSLRRGRTGNQSRQPPKGMESTCAVLLRITVRAISSDWQMILVRCCWPVEIRAGSSQSASRGSPGDYGCRIIAVAVGQLDGRNWSPRTIGVLGIPTTDGGVRHCKAYESKQPRSLDHPEVVPEEHGEFHEFWPNCRPDLVREVLARPAIRPTTGTRSPCRWLPLR